MIVLIESFDLDKDGKVTQAEIDQAAQGPARQVRHRPNGALSLEEYQALWPDAMRRAMVRQFQANDADGDGSDHRRRSSPPASTTWSRTSTATATAS